MINTQLAKAISLALAGTAISVGASNAFAAQTMYNTWNAGAPAGYDAAAYAANPASAPSYPTDGWTYQNNTRADSYTLLNGTVVNTTVNTGGTNDGYYPSRSDGSTMPATVVRPAYADTTAARQAWVGTDGAGSLPFNYAGRAALNWAIKLTSVTDAGVISSADSLSRYGVAADIDTAKGAWVDAQATPTGWRHAVDFGLIQTEVDTYIKLSATALSQFSSNFGISVYDGMDTSTAKWSHHGSWHSGYILGDTSATNLARVNGDDPISTVGLDFITFADGSNIGDYGNDYVTFHALAGHTYTVILGGSDGGQSWSNPQAQYALSVAAVPVPGAVWLFGSAILGMVGFGRRKSAVSA